MFESQKVAPLIFINYELSRQKHVKQLTKEQRGSLMIVNSRLTDASQFQPFSIASVGKDKRFKLMSDYEKDLSNNGYCKEYYDFIVEDAMPVFYNVFVYCSDDVIWQVSWKY